MTFVTLTINLFLFLFPKLTHAQMRAALGINGMDDAQALLQAHEQQQLNAANLQRELLLQQLLSQQHQERSINPQIRDLQQLYSSGDQLEEFPDLQQHYRNLLLMNRPPEPQHQHQLLQQQNQSGLASLLLQEEILKRQQQQLGLQPESSFAQQQQLGSLDHAALSVSQAAGVTPSQAALLLQQANLQHNAGLSNEELTQRLLKRIGSTEDSEAQQQDGKRPKLSPPAVQLGRQQDDRKPPPPVATAAAVYELHSDGGFAVPQQQLPVAPQFRDILADAVELVTPVAPFQAPRGNISSLVAALDALDPIEEVADALRALGGKKKTIVADKDEPLPPLPPPSVDGPVVFSKKRNESVSLPGFSSALPILPKEILPVGVKRRQTVQQQTIEDLLAPEQEIDEPLTTRGTPIVQNTGKKKVIVQGPTDFPSVDTWYPSETGVRRERRSDGETTDEDQFEDSSSPAGSVFKANEPKIRERLATLEEPGLVEKLPHCRLHRVRSKQQNQMGNPEHLFCWQVADLYPDEVMVCCSRCSTWRHAACGGHFCSFSSRQNSREPFVAVCEACHEEEKYLAENPIGASRVERQRTELTRRALATNAVMRQASFAKHSTTYKWPLGSVPTTHFTGHSRSIQARYDKAEKQWSDMSSRLGRGVGYRPKERVKCRTKELERLLTSVEDAETYTERHNMLHFLMRDCAREVPIGFENQVTNILDPEVKPAVVTNPCARVGCRSQRRFDSIFCCDGCGLSCIENDLRRSLVETAEIHPSLLRM